MNRVTVNMLSIPHVVSVLSIYVYTRLKIRIQAINLFACVSHVGCTLMVLTHDNRASSEAIMGSKNAYPDHTFPRDQR